MEPFDNFKPDVPMSVKMRRASEAFKRMAPEERIHLLVEAGLMTEVEYKEAVERLSQKTARPWKPKSRRKPNPKKPVTD
jgi:acetyl-CoA carboxylase beta subunit